MVCLLERYIMVRSIIFLVFALIAAGVYSYVAPVQMTPEQWDMLKVSGYIMLGVVAACFVLSEVTRNYSQVDKIWSIIPMVYMWYFMYSSHWDIRVVLMGICVTIWGVRLTYNFGRKGGYRWRFWEGEEDYRWEVLRENPTFKGKPLNWKLFSFFFIALYQNVLLWLITLPAIIVYGGKDKPLGMWDIALVIIVLTLIVIETVADQQQWDFQNEKHRLKAAGILQGGHASGFIQTGLFAHSRHPNYAAEQLIWVVVYLFSIAAAGVFVNWSIMGCLLLLILFQGSANFSEGISLSKYPSYADYQKRVPMFLMRWW